MIKHLTIKLYGRVQGVFFRQTTLEEALKLSLKGTVQNMPDGSVEVHAEGDKEDINQLIKWCQQGPEHARVERVETIEVKAQNYQNFTII